MIANTAGRTLALLPFAALSVLGCVTAQEPVRNTGTAVSGGTITVEAATNDSVVEISAAGDSHVDSYPIPPGGKVTMPVPPVPGGTFLFITIGRGLRAKVILVEVIEP